jgi:peptidoglycan-N-acetylglucosamine deacetylase
MAEPRTVVGVDLDDLRCYHAIYGLPPPPPECEGMALRRWLPRFLELFEELDGRATLFVIGADAARDLAGEGLGAAQLRAAVAHGHELGNHSHVHAYDLVRWSDAAMAEDLRACDAVLRALGAEPQGLRAPGYSHDDRMLQCARELGYRYDSSALPSPAYYLAKLAVLAWQALRGRPSASTSAAARTFFGPRRPHVRADLGLTELPISVAGWPAIPLIGTWLLHGPLRPALVRAAQRKPFFNLELHAIDLADARLDDLSPALVRREPSLSIPWTVRRERLRNLLRARGGFSPLRDAVP